MTRERSPPWCARFLIAVEDQLGYRFIPKPGFDEILRLTQETPTCRILGKFFHSPAAPHTNPQGNTKYRVRDLVQPRFCRGKRDKNR